MAVALAVVVGALGFNRFGPPQGNDFTTVGTYTRVDDLDPGTNETEFDEPRKHPAAEQFHRGSSCLWVQEPTGLTDTCPAIPHADFDNSRLYITLATESSIAQLSPPAGAGAVAPTDKIAYHPGVCTLLEMDYQHFTPARTGAWVGTSMCGPAWGYQIMNSVLQEPISNTAALTPDENPVESAYSAQRDYEAPVPNWAPVGCEDGTHKPGCLIGSVAGGVRSEATAGTLPFSSPSGDPPEPGQALALCKGVEVQIPEVLNLDFCYACNVSSDCATGFECIDSTWTIDSVVGGVVKPATAGTPYIFTVVPPTVECNHTKTCVAQTLPTNDILACQLRNHPSFKSWHTDYISDDISWITAFAGSTSDTKYYHPGYEAIPVSPTNTGQYKDGSGITPLFYNTVTQAAEAKPRLCKLLAYDEFFEATSDTPCHRPKPVCRSGYKGLVPPNAAPYYGKSLKALDMTPTMLNALRQIMAHEIHSFAKSSLPGCPFGEAWSCENYSEIDCPPEPACSLLGNKCIQFSPVMEDRCIAAYDPVRKHFRPDLNASEFTDACCKIETPHFKPPVPDSDTFRVVRRNTASVSRPLFTIAADLNTHPQALQSRTDCWNALKDGVPSRSTMGFVIPENMTSFDYGTYLEYPYESNGVTHAYTPPEIHSTPTPMMPDDSSGTYTSESKFSLTWPQNDLTAGKLDANFFNAKTFKSRYFTFGKNVQCEMLVEGRHFFDPGHAGALIKRIDDLNSPVSQTGTPLSAPAYENRLCVPKNDYVTFYATDVPQQKTTFRFTVAVSAIATARYLQAPEPNSTVQMPPQFLIGGPGGLLTHDPRVSVYYAPQDDADTHYQTDTDTVIVADDMPQLMCCAAGARCNVNHSSVEAFWELQSDGVRQAQCGSPHGQAAPVGKPWQPTIGDLNSRTSQVATGPIGLQLVPINRTIRVWGGANADDAYYGLVPHPPPNAGPVAARVVPISVTADGPVEFVVIVENAAQFGNVSSWRSQTLGADINVTVFLVGVSSLSIADAVVDASNPCGAGDPNGRQMIVDAQLGSPGFDALNGGTPTAWLSMPNDNNYKASANAPVSGSNRPELWYGKEYLEEQQLPGSTRTWVYPQPLTDLFEQWGSRGTNKDCQIEGACDGVLVQCDQRAASLLVLAKASWPSRDNRNGAGPLPATSLFEDVAIQLRDPKYITAPPPGFSKPLAAHRYVSLLSEPDLPGVNVPRGCRQRTFVFSRQDVFKMWAESGRKLGSPSEATSNVCNKPDLPGGQMSTSARPPNFPTDGRAKYTCSGACAGGCPLQNAPRQLPFTNGNSDGNDGMCRPNFWSQPAGGADWSTEAGSALSPADIALDTVAFTTNVQDTTPASVGFGAGAAPMRAITAALPVGPSDFPVPADSKTRPWTPAHDPDAAKAVCRCGEGIEWACETLTAAFIQDTYNVAVNYQVRVCGYSWAGLGITGIGTAGEIGLYVGSDYVSTTVVERDSTKLYNGTLLTDLIGVRKPLFRTLKTLVGSGSEWQLGVDATTTYPGACLRWPYGRLHRSALGTTDKQKYFPDYESDRPAGHDEALVGYCEKIDGRYLGCTGDPHTEDDRDLWCTKRKQYTGKLFLGKMFLMDEAPCATVPADNGVLCVVYAAHPRFPNVGAVTEWAQKNLKYDGGNGTSLHLVVAPFGYAVASSLLLEQTTFDYHQSVGDEQVSWLAQYFSGNEPETSRWTKGDPVAPVQGITDGESMLLQNLSSFAVKHNSTKHAADAAIAVYESLYGLIKHSYDGKISPACTALQTYLPVPPAVNMKEQLEPVLPPGGSCIDSVQWGPHLVARGAVISVPNVYIRSGLTGKPINVAGTAALSFSPSPSGLCTALIIRQPGVVVDPLVIDQAGCNGGPGYASIGVVVTGDSAAGGLLKGVTVKNAEGSAAVGILGGDRDYSASRPTLNATGLRIENITISRPVGSLARNYDAAVAHVRSTSLTLPENATVLLEELSAAETVVFTNRVALTNVSDYTSVFGQPYEQQYYHPPIDMTHAAITALAVLSATGAAQAWALVQLMRSNVLGECPAPGAQEGV